MLRYGYEKRTTNADCGAAGHCGPSRHDQDRAAKGTQGGVDTRRAAGEVRPRPEGKEIVPRRSLQLTQAEINFCEQYRKRKGMRDIADMLRIALHSYVARNKATGIVPPWDIDVDIPDRVGHFARCEIKQEGN